MITPSHADVIFRRIPENFIGPQYSYSGNNVYEAVQNADGSVRRELVGQLEAATRRSGMEAAQLSRIPGGMDALSALGSVASVLNLGVSIVGFGLVLRGLQRIDNRLQQVDRKVDALTGAVTVVDRKVDALIGAVTVVDRKVDAVVAAMGIFDQQLEHLLDMGMAQAQATERLTQLMISFESAKVRAAVETLDARRGRVHRPEAREDVRAAARDLATWRAWLSSRRESLEADDLQLRAEIMRHEVLVLTAEAGAWCMLGDAEHASILVDKLRQSLRAEAVGVLRRLFDEESVVGFLRADLGKHVDSKKELIN